MLINDLYMLQLSALGGRYKFLVDGSMQIIGLIKTDAGIYICRADNGIGRPVEKEFIVRVRGKYLFPYGVFLCGVAF